MITSKLRRGRTRQSHCKRGHMFDGKNLRTRLDRRGYVVRICRRCEAFRSAERLIAKITGSTQ